MGEKSDEGELKSFVVPLPPGTEILHGPLADLTLAVGLDGFEPSPPAMAEMIGGWLGDVELTGLGGAVELRESRLVVRVAPLPGSIPATRLSKLGLLLNKPTRLKLADATEVTAELGHLLGATVSMDAQGHIKHEHADLELDHWRYGSEPAAWFGSLEGVEFEQGNLFVGRGTPVAPVRWSTWNLRLSGNFIWHVVRSARGYRGLIEGGRPLVPELVHADVTALEFTLGARLRLGALVGVDGDGTPVAAAAPIMARHRPTGSFPLSPVPPWMERQAWMPRFFEAIARALAGPQSTRFYVAINTYLDSISESLDSAYLRLQVALEAFCRYADEPLPSLVSSEATWREWVEAHRVEIEQFASDQRSALRLLDKVRAAPRQRPSSDAVGAAFANWKLDVPSIEMAEIEGRHLAAHRYLMNVSEDVRDMERDGDRVAIMRTLLVAAVAREAGYGGPIHGWAGKRFGQPAWWPISEDVAIARRWYACLRENLDGTTT